MKLSVKLNIENYQNGSDRTKSYVVTGEERLKFNLVT